MTRILIVEDNPDLAFGLQKTLEFEGYEVEWAAEGPRGLERAREWAPDLVLLDLMLPGMDGFKILRELRGGGSKVPILVLTARGDEADVVLGFDLGADDYVTKPYSTSELVARVRAILRRGAVEANSANGEAHPGRFGSVEMDAASRTVQRGGEEVQLSPKEFDLLMALYERDGAVASRNDLLDEVWGYGSVDILTRTVDVHIAELRKKLEDDPSNPVHILTVRKAGYRLKR